MKKLSNAAMEAARRIAERNRVPLKDVLDAYEKAFRRSSAVNKPILFLPK